MKILSDDVLSFISVYDARFADALSIKHVINLASSNEIRLKTSFTIKPTVRDHQNGKIIKNFTKFYFFISR